MAEGIFFTSPEHKTRFVETMEQIGRIYDEKYDAEYATAIYILSSDTIMWEKSKDEISRDGIDFKGMLKGRDWTGGYRRLVALAWNLFNGHEKADLAGVIDSVSEEKFKIVVSSILIRRHGLRVDNLSLPE
jgi:hypothetical protein